MTAATFQASYLLSKFQFDHGRLVLRLESQLRTHTVRRLRTVDANFRCFLLVNVEFNPCLRYITFARYLRISIDIFAARMIDNKLTGFRANLSLWWRSTTGSCGL